MMGADMTFFKWAFGMLALVVAGMLGLAAVQIGFVAMLKFWHSVRAEMHAWRDRPYCLNCKAARKAEQALDRMVNGQ